MLQFLLAGERFGHRPQRDPIMTQPMQISPFRGNGLVLTTNDRTGELKGLAGVHAKLLYGSFIAFKVYPSLNHT